MSQNALVVATAYISDLIFGDPAWLPHPVKGIGYIAQKIETFLCSVIKNERTSGVVFALVIIGAAYAVSLTVINTLSHYNRNISLIVSVFIVYTTLAVKDLKVEAMRVYRALEEGDSGAARKHLSMIVGRDTKNMDDAGMVRATVETIAENTVDGIIAPIFYAFLGGAPLALAYKAASTLDSMVGYKNERYKYFGWASAKIDDILNYIPARLSALVMPVAALLVGLDGRGSFRTVLRDRRNNPSPNSGIPEAAVAGALGVRLGGLNYYDGTAVMKPYIGDDTSALTLRHIKDSLKIAYMTSFLSVLTAYTVRI